MLQYGLIRQDSKTIVVFEGDMDIDSTEIIEEELTPKLLNSKEIEIDFAKVPFVDSSGIGLLITLITSLRDEGSRVVIVNLSSEVEYVFSLLQLPEILGREVFADLQG